MFHRALKIIPLWLGVRPSQCDQMAWLFVQYLAIYNNENLPNICQTMCIILPTTKYLLKKWLNTFLS